MNEVNLSGVLYLNSTSGNVGIGTTNPSNPLTLLTGGLSGPAILINSTGNSFNESNYIEFSKQGFSEKGVIGALGEFEMNLGYNLDYKNSTHQFYNLSRNAFWLTLQDNGIFLQYAPKNYLEGNDIWSGQGSLITWQVDTSGNETLMGSLTLGTNNSRNTRIKSTGLGTLVLSSKKGYNFNEGITDTTLMQLNESGNLGIGTTNPTSKLTINASNAISSGGIRLLGFTYPNDISYWSESQFAMQYNGVYVNTINSNGNSYFKGGNVGINTTTPISKLEVNGNVSITGTNALLNLAVITLPSCSTSTNHSIAVNLTGVYYCNSTQSWTLMVAG